MTGASVSWPTILVVSVLPGALRSSTDSTLEAASETAFVNRVTLRLKSEGPKISSPFSVMMALAMPALSISIEYGADGLRTVKVAWRTTGAPVFRTNVCGPNATNDAAEAGGTPARLNSDTSRARRPIAEASVLRSSETRQVIDPPYGRRRVSELN